VTVTINTGGSSAMGFSKDAPFVPLTEVVHPDEKAWRLKELPMMRQMGKARELRRIQFVWVQRNGIIYEWSRDLGPAASFTAPGCDIPSLWEHTVGELWDIAENQRLKDDHWQKFAAEGSAESRLFDDWREQVEERSKVIRNRSVFWRGGHKQRNGFPRKAILERNQN